MKVDFTPDDPETQYLLKLRLNQNKENFPTNKEFTAKQELRQ